MASIEKRGETFRIRVFVGYDAHGKKLTKSKTWKPDPGMTKRQIEKELERQKVLFEEQVSKGQYSNLDVKFETFANDWIEQVEKEGKLKPLTIKRLKDCKERTYAAIGHLKVSRITTRQIQMFINNLTEEGIRRDIKYKPTVSLSEEIRKVGMSQRKFAELIDLSVHTLQSAVRYNNVTATTAQKICQGINKPITSVFEVASDIKKPLSTKTQESYLCFISDVFKYAITSGIIRDNPCKGVQPIIIETEEREIYTVEEAKKFLELLAEAPKKYVAFFLLDLFGGFRRAEILGLEWKDIDFDSNVISIRRTSLYAKEKGGIFTGTTKTKGSTRSLKMPEQVIRFLMELRIEQNESRILAGDRWIETDRLFTQWNGKPMYPDTARHWLGKFCKAHDIKYVNVHSFRHLNASLLINSGTDVKTVSAALGHSQVTTTLNIYAHSFAIAQAKASDAIADAIDIGQDNSKKEA